MFGWSSTRSRYNSIENRATEANFKKLTRSLNNLNEAKKRDWGSFQWFFRSCSTHRSSKEHELVKDCAHNREFRVLQGTVNH